MMTFPSLCLVALTLAGTTAAPVSKASALKADQLFKEARALMRQNRFEEASVKLIESQGLEPATVTLLNLGLCHEGMGRRGRALLELRETAAEAAADREVLELANEHASALEAQLPGAPLPAIHVTFASRSGADGIDVSLDGIGLKPALLAKPIPVDPGEHELVAQDARGQINRQIVQAHDRETAEVKVAFEDEPQPVLPPAVVDTSGATAKRVERVVPIIVVDGNSGWCTAGCKTALAVAGGGLVVAVGTGLKAHFARNDFDDKNRDPGASTGERTSAHDSAERWQWVNLGFWGVTVGSAVTAAVLIGLRSSDARGAMSTTAVVPMLRRDGFGVALSTEWSAP